ncbi:hypothetical protein A3709_10290 [Halioglobus sp. HI00S01]|uniref:hypothetical protein n=1 Tax=Halioglobus sp. HI00S01 TaxID=1822214 RepID=UPI0007C2444D|nr:hypothetical protein [Halioglobus sp. HI00S01]KZX53505.1 hypothetical protein A3709_10290 [Halioglobus sp. HI00S01]
MLPSNSDNQIVSLILGALKAALPAQGSRFAIGEVLASNFAQTEWLTRYLLIKLEQSSVLILENNEDTPPRMRDMWRIERIFIEPIEGDSFIYPKNDSLWPTPPILSPGLERLVLQVQIDECQGFIRECLLERDMDCGTACAPTHRLAGLLAHATQAQVFTCLEAAVNALSPCQLKLLEYGEKGFALQREIGDLAHGHFQLHSRMRRTVPPYNGPKTVLGGTLSRSLFNDYLRCGDSYFNVVDPIEHSAEGHIYEARR